MNKREKFYAISHSHINNTISLIYFFISGCASVSSSTQQKISIQAIKNNNQIYGAICKLKNKQGEWETITPNDVSIRKSGDPLFVYCTDNENIYSGQDTFESTVSQSMWGNVLLGGVPGVVVDGLSSSGFEYPSNLIIFLQRNSQTQDKESITP
ncbi:hypothetical protein [Azonexus sp.]|uniref:hypothetical protein n=1 Tax=Azonexus sp. TaxID=1872668 RepID=UPI0035AE4F47